MTNAPSLVILLDKRTQYKGINDWYVCVSAVWEFWIKHLHPGSCVCLLTALHCRATSLCMHYRSYTLLHRINVVCMLKEVCTHQCTVCICLCVWVCVHVYMCVCGSVSGIKKPSHRQSPAVNETGPDVDARGVDRMPLGAISLSFSLALFLSVFLSLTHPPT